MKMHHFCERICVLLKLPIVRRLFIFGALSLVLCFCVNAYVFFSADDFITDKFPARYTAVVLGARVYPDGSLSDAYADRLMTGADLYRSGKVRKIIVSADHRSSHNDESNAGLRFLLSKGIPKKDIFTDHAGFDTYDSMIRAKKVFCVDDALIVSQRFHLHRSVYLARSFGIDAYGVSADRQRYKRIVYFHVREFFSRVKAFINVQAGADPHFLGEKIPVTGDSSLSDG